MIKHLKSAAFAAIVSALFAGNLLVGAGTAQAQGVLCEGSPDPVPCDATHTNAVQILGVEVQGVGYDVVFVNDTVEDVYGQYPGTYTFADGTSDGRLAQIANSAVVAALNTAPTVTTVGPSESAFFDIGYRGFLQVLPEGNIESVSSRRGEYLDGGPLPAGWSPSSDVVTAPYDSFVSTFAVFSITSPCSTDADCDDGVFCNGGEVCGNDGQCLAGALDFPCAEGEACVEEGDQCVATADNQPPVADANGPYTGEAGVAVTTFDGSASSDPDGTIETYAWEFGDGNTGSGVTPTHTYAAANVYNVILTVTDNDGVSDSDSTQANIGQSNQPPVGNLPPVADANGPYGGDVGANISFDGNASDDPDGTIVSWEWRFGDGTTDTGPTPTHSYSEAGKYLVILTVTDDRSVPDSTLTFADIGPVDLTGTVEDATGTPLCALALASGQFMFTCNPNGPYDLQDLPRQNDGTVKRQVYVDGFFPNVETLPGSTDDTVVMTRATNCPDYNSFPEPSVVPGSDGKRIDVSGTILLQNTQTPVCAMALANGQFGFTCDDTGTYSATIPLDANGQYKLQVYADGFAPMVQRFDEFTPDVEVRLARADECQ
jgi:PKD repeat protein